VGVADLIETDAEDADADAPQLERFLRDFDSAATPSQLNRAQALQARRFAFIPGAQWEGDGWEDFSENMIRVQVNKTRKGLRKIFNDYRANRVTVDFRTEGDDGGDDETADTLDGRFRADAYRCRAGMCFDNAFDEGTSGGLGAWRLCNELEDKHDPDNDHQVINFEPIVDADQSVYFDPNSKNYDKSDAMWGCVISAVARQAFVDEWGEDRATDWPQGFVKPIYDWFTPDVIRVCEWYQVEEQKERRWTLTNAITGEEMKVWDRDVSKEWLNEQLAGGWTQTGRSVPRRRVHKYKLSGAEILEDCGLIAGPNIPVILYYGERRFIDNQERFDGHVADAMDPQRIYNSQVSRLVETSATSPRETPIVTPEQMSGHDKDWARAGKDRLPFLYLNPIIGEDGTQQPIGPIGKLEPSQVGPVAAALLQITAADIADLTNADDGADETKANVSHEAMDLAATRTDEKSSGYMDNFKLSMEWCGRVYLGMAKETYVEEGRELTTRGPDGEEGKATLLEPKVNDNGRYLTVNDFANGKFNVLADVTESSATKRDKTVRKALGVAQIAGSNGDTETSQAALITAVENMDGDGMDDFKAWNRKKGLAIGLFKPTDQEQQEMQQEAASNAAQPDPTKVVLLAQAKKLSADADKATAQAGTEQANVVLKLADAHLKNEQARAVGGPEAVPETPTGLDHASGIVDIAHKAADTTLKEAQAEHLRHDMQHKTIKRGHELALDAAGHELDVRQQDHAESAANDKAAA
jgi:hypothetical protein